MRFNGQLFHLNFNETGYRRALHNAAQTQVRQAARAWLRAVIPLVPVWTGMARGSLKPLGRFLRVAVPIVPSSTARITPFQNQAAGEQRQEFKFLNSNAVYTFEYNTGVLHYYLNEFYDMKATFPNLIHPTPWKSWTAGKEAADTYFTTVAPTRMPKYADFVYATPITPR